MLQLTINPGLTLAGFQTIRPSILTPKTPYYLRTTVAIFLCKNLGTI